MSKNKTPKVTEKDLDFLYAVIDDSCDLRHSSTDNEERKNKARKILEDLISLAKKT